MWKWLKLHGIRILILLFILAPPVCLSTGQVMGMMMVKNQLPHIYPMTDTVTADLTVTIAMLHPPIATTSAATGVTDDSAVLNGTLNDGNAPCVLTWFWGLVDEGETESWTNNVTESGQVTGAISQNVTGSLLPNTLYIFIVKAVNAAGTDWSATANFTTMAEGAFPDPPGSFMLTDLGAITIQMDWMQNAVGDNVTIWVKRNSAPAGIVGEEVAYSGNATSANWTGFALDTTEYFFVIRSYSGIAYSTEYLADSIGGEGVEEIANQLTNFNTLINEFLVLLKEIIPYIMPLLIFLVAGVIVFLINYFAYRFGERWLFLAGGFSLIIYGFGVWQYITYLSILLVITGIYHLGKAGWDKGAWTR